MPGFVFLGPPGAGKGTQATRLARERGLLHLSTGDVLRAAVAEGTALGREAEGFMNRGELVPDALVIRIVQARLTGADARDGFILDGFPRTAAQAEALDAVAHIDRVLSFELPESYLLDRLTQRRHCPTCGTVYNLATAPPKQDPGRCDKEGEALLQRADDRPEAVKTRLEAYRRLTAPLVEYYRRRGVLVAVEATGTPEEVAERIRNSLR